MPQPHEPNRRRFLQAGLLGCAAAAAGEAAPNDPAIKPFELDEMGIAELQEGMKSGKWTARALAERYLARIEEIDKDGPAVNAVIELNPDALEIADALDKERKDKGPRPAARHPHPHQGQHRHRRQDGDHRGFAGPGRVEAAEGRLPRRAAAQGRGRHARQDEPQRVGQHPLQLLDQRLERPRRPDAQPLRPGPQHFRLQLRFGGGRRRQPVRRRRRHRDRRLHRQPVVGQRRRRHQADRRPRQPFGGHSHLPHQDTAGPMGRTVPRRGDPAGRAGGGRPGRSAPPFLPRADGGRRGGQGRTPTTRSSWTPTA